MGSSKKQTVGYWYRPLIHFGWCQAPIDAFLQFRGGDRPAWEGRLTESGTILIDAPDLWGGTDSEGGIQGDFDVMFGEQDQDVNAYLATHMAETSAFRAKASGVFKRGRYGAMNPYPKPASFKLERILKGWDEDECWYPEKATIGVAGVDSGTLVTAVSAAGQYVDHTGEWIGLGGDGFHKMIATPRRYIRANSGGAEWADSADLNWTSSVGSLGHVGGPGNLVYFDDTIMFPGGLYGVYRSIDEGENIILDPEPEAPAAAGFACSQDLVLASCHSDNTIWHASKAAGPWTPGPDCGIYGGYGIMMVWGDRTFMLAGSDTTVFNTPKIVTTTDGVEFSLPETLPSLPGADYINGLAYAVVNGVKRYVASTDNGLLIYRTSTTWNLASGVVMSGLPVTNALQFATDRFYFRTTDATWESFDGVNWVESTLAVGSGQVAGGLTFDNRTFQTRGINPAHIVYDSLASQFMQGEPVELINDASFRGAADTLHSESFAVCTEYDPDAETVEEFRQRICTVIAASCSRSRVNGQWYLDLIRGEYVLEDLPILADSDILEFQEEPTLIDDAVNQVVVEWFDPVAKEVRSTAPVHALGAIQATGTIISETIKFPEIPYETLALRVAERELRKKATPLKRYKEVCNRTPHAWRIGTYFRLQAPKRGIADMVCMVGDIDTGTLRSGAIPLVAVQDVFSMPSTSYVVGQPSESTATPPTGSPYQLLIEAPYVELAALMPTTELSAMADDAGYILSLAARPTSGRNYELLTAAAGEEYDSHGLAEWCPHALVVEAADPLDTEFTLSDGVDLSRVSVGTAALWGDEITRVDALDKEAGTISLGRGCADTIPWSHAAGERIWFYDEWRGTDSREYVLGETVRAKYLSRTSSSKLAESLAFSVSTVMAGRAALPYPPGNVQIDGDPYPPAVSETFNLTWAHRDRVLQADQLVDTMVGNVGPDTETRYAVRVLDDADALLVEKLDIAGAVAAIVLDYTGDVTVQLYSINEAGESLQRHERTFAYTPPAGTVTTAITAATYTPTDEIIDGGEIT